MIFLLRLVKIFMIIIYAFLKLLPTRKNKIVFLSRQTNTPSIDYKMLVDAIEKQNSDIKIVVMCKRIEKKPVELVRFVWMILRSMYHLATARVCILDAYWPAVSMLNHKDDLTVIQIWHAMGKIKQSGYKNLDSEAGRGREIAYVLGMHKNYDLIVAGGEAWNKFYCESFNVSEEVLYNVGLPRIDYLLIEKDNLRARIFTKYPELSGKPSVIYAPTWRRTGIDGWDEFIRLFDFNKFNLILKCHPNQNLRHGNPHIYDLKEFSTLDCLAIADYLVTDYSAIAVEAAAIDVKTYYYLYDYEVYNSKNGLNIDLFEEMPGCAFTTASELIENLNLGNYNVDALKNYQQKFLPARLGQSTNLIVDKIMESLEE